MLGVLIAIVSIIGVVVLTVIRREYPLFILIAIFVLMAELGTGYTSLNGSIFFNEGFLGLAKFKLIEIIFYPYAGLLMLSDIYHRRRFAPSALRRLYWAWLAWLVVLLFVQFDTHGYLDFTIFRGVYFGWALLYVFTSVIDSRPMMRRVIIFTFALITIKALWLMFIFLLGGGDQTVRGRSPIYFDDKLLDGFTWALLVFLVVILQRRNKNGGWPVGWAAAGLILFAIIIALSLRRNNVAQLLIGAIFVLFSKGRQVQWQRVIILTLAAAIFLGAVFSAGQLIGNRLPIVKQLTSYIQLFDFSSFTSVPANAVHVFNVQTYVTILEDYPGIRYFGVSAAPTENFRNFNREYESDLGVAHNGPLRAIFEMGIGGLIIWASFFFLTLWSFRRCQLERLESWEGALAIGSAAAIFAQYIITLTLVPPFFTTFKSFFFFLFMVYTVEFYARDRVYETQTATEVLSHTIPTLPGHIRSVGPTDESSVSG